METRINPGVCKDDEMWRHPTDPHPHELNRWEDEGGRAGDECEPDEVHVNRRGTSMLRMLALILILLALLGGGFGYAAHVAVELLWVCVVLLIVGVILGGFDYYNGPRYPEF